MARPRGPVVSLRWTMRRTVAARAGDRDLLDLGDALQLVADADIARKLGAIAADADEAEGDARHPSAFRRLPVGPHIVGPMQRAEIEIGPARRQHIARLRRRIRDAESRGKPRDRPRRHELGRDRARCADRILQRRKDRGASLFPRCLDRLPHLLGRRRHVDMRDAERRERIDHGVHDRGERADIAGLARAFDAERIGLGRHRVLLDLERRTYRRRAACRNP